MCIGYDRLYAKTRPYRPGRKRLPVRRKKLPNPGGNLTNEKEGLTELQGSCRIEGQSVATNSRTSAIVRLKFTPEGIFLRWVRASWPEITRGIPGICRLTWERNFSKLKLPVMPVRCVYRKS